VLPVLRQSGKVKENAHLTELQALSSLSSLIQPTSSPFDGYLSPIDYEKTY
jgi:hypothetical protein